MRHPPDIRAIPLPTPFAIGTVNAYLLDGSPLTLVDPGPHMQSTREALDRELAEAGYRVEDTEQVILTHQHHDHIGLAAEVAERADAPVAALDRLARFLADFEGSMDVDDRYSVATMLRNGVEAQVAETLSEMSRAFRVFGHGARVDRTLVDGDEIEAGGRTLTVLVRPGHSPTDTIFLDQDSGLLVGGDHLLEHITSNPVAHAPVGVGDPEAASAAADRPRPLARYLDSMRATSALPISLVLPGHGDPFAGAADLIERRLRFHRRRMRKIERLLDGPTTAAEVATKLWRGLPVTQTYLALSEVLGHADLLLEEGAIAESVEGEVVRYAPVTR